MNEISEVRRTIQMLGIESTGKYRLRFWVYCLVLPFLTFSSMSYMIYNWEITGKRMDGLKGVVIYLLCQSYVFIITFKWDQVLRLQEILEEGFYEVLFAATKDRLCLERRIKDRITQLTSIWRYIVDAIVLFVTLPPILQLALHIRRNGAENVPIKNMKLPLAFHYPNGFDTLPMYIFALSMEGFFFLQGTRTGILVAITPFLSMQHIVGDLQLLRQAVEELDHILLCSREPISRNDDADNLETNFNEATTEFLVYFVKHQKYIYGKADDVSRGIQHVAFILETGMSVLLCTSIYIVAQSGDVMIKLQEAFIAFSLIYCLYCYHAMGEEVTFESENIRQALYRISWTDKPLRFKKSLHVILTRMTRKLEIKRHGIFTLNLQNFVMTARDAYSFYNVVNKLT